MKILRKIGLNGPIHSVSGAALIIAVAGIGSRLFGFLRDRILAAQFGAGDTLDAYYAAFRIPDLLYSFLVLGALSAAFIPVFTELYVQKKEKEAWELSSQVLHLLVFSLGLASIVAAIFMHSLMEVLVPGFSPEKKALAEQFTRIMLLSPMLLGISAVFGGVLVSLKRFVLYSLAPIFYNLGIIFGAVFLVKLMGQSGLAWGVVLGALLHVAVQYLDLRICGFRYRFALSGIWKNEAVRRVILLMIPRSLAMAINQISFLVVTIFASTLVSGSLSVFTLANNIQSVPLGLFGVAFSLAVFPSLSALAAKKADGEFFHLFANTFRRILFFVLPVSVLMIVLRAQIVRVILGSGQFDWHDTIATFGVLGILSVSLFAQSLIPLLARAFFALQNTKTPLYIALVSEAFHVILIFIFMGRYQINGLAIAFSIATTINMLLLYVFLRRQFASWKDSDIFSPSMKIIAASLVAGIIAQLTKAAFGFNDNELDTFVAIFIQLLVTSAVGISVFIALSWWMRIEEFERVKTFFVRRIFGQPQNLVEAEEEAERGSI
ncbi:MAG: murein biosynthesis integral membrane protein MurJ [Candidatus Moranbacteria bacterium]|nr:murein biosynthesis integral membrane protein MurJ [Candidatus Moranbacteria bacterium]